MTVQLNPNAVTLLANTFGASSYAYNNLMSAAQASSYFAGQLNAMAAAGGTITIGPAGQGTSARGNAVTIDPGIVPTGPTSPYNLMFAPTVAHEFAHVLSPQVESSTAPDPHQAIVRGETNEGVAVVAEYIVGRQLTAPGATLRINSDRDNKITPELHAIAQRAGINVSQIQFGSADAHALTHTGSDAVAAAGTFYGNETPSGALNLIYDEYYAAAWIVRNCGGIDPSTVDWNKVTSKSIDWDQASDGSCTVNAKSVPLKSYSSSTGGTLDITGEISPTGQPISLKVSTFDDEGVLESQRDVFANGTSTKTVFDTGTEPWSKDTSEFNVYQRLQSQRVDFDNGSQQIKKYDPDNNHPYKQLDVTKGPNGEISAAQLQLEANIIAAGGSVGQIFGSALGRALAPDHQFAELAVGTVAGLIGQKLLQTFTASLTLDASRFVAGKFADVTGLDVAHAGIGAISSFLTAELGRALHLTGFGAELFNGAVGGVTGSVLNQIVDKVAAGYSFDAAVGFINWGTAATQAGYNISSAAGSFLAHAFVPAQSHEGAVGGQLLGAVGSALGLSAVLNATITGFMGFLIPGLGSFFGTIVGTMLGDAIAGDPVYPMAYHDVRILGADYHFTSRLVGTDNHGNAAVSEEMGDQVAAIANSYLDAVHGAGIHFSGKVMTGYNAGAAPYQYIAGWFPNGTEVAAHFANAAEAIQEGVRELLVNTEVIGGDLLVKRAHQAFINGPHPAPTEIAPDFTDLIKLSGDLSVAQDYQNYLNNREAINALMAANPDTAFTAGWIATFARVNDLGLNQVHGSDFTGGLVGFLDSVNKAGLGAEAANAIVKRGSDNSVIVEIKVDNGAEVPGALSVFADHMTVTSDASGQTLQFTVDNGVVASGTLLLGPGTGSAGHDIMVGGAADDVFTAGAGWDFVDGGAGSDYLFGQDGSDILRGGRGNDFLFGGQGDDTYVFTRGDGVDVVYDEYHVVHTYTEAEIQLYIFYFGHPPDPNEPVNAGSDTLVFGPGIAKSDIAVQRTGNDLIVGVKDPAHPGAQPTDWITLKDWAIAFNRIETFGFADGTTLNLSGGDASLAAYLVPFGETLSRSSVAENSPIGTVVGTVAGFDFAAVSLSYSLASDPSGYFAINASTGVITTTVPLDYETNAAHSWQIKVRISDGAHVFDQPFTINVTDANDKPTDIILSGGSAPEDSPGGTVIAAAHGIDPDAGTAWHYSLTDNAGGRFLIYQTGQIAIVDRGLIDFETANSYHITVRAADQYGLFVDKEFTLAVTDVYERVHSDFNGDGRSDILLRDDSGMVAVWNSGVPSGGHVVADPGPASSWHIAGLGDFDGNARADILWQNNDGTVAVWDNGTPSGGHVVAGAGAAAGWQLAGVGDFDGNHRGDILWQNDSGAVAVWDNGTPAGGRMIADSGTAGWHVAATADFDGNGKEDVLWRNDSGALAVWDNGTPAGGHSIADPGLAAAGWHFITVGDFDGNRHDDILWRNDSGALALWNNGAAAGGHSIADPGPAANWHVAGAADFDGNGKADILWRDDAGALALWDNGTPAGGHMVADAMAASWHIV